MKIRDVGMVSRIAYLSIKTTEHHLLGVEVYSTPFVFFTNTIVLVVRTRGSGRSIEITE